MGDVMQGGKARRRGDEFTRTKEEEEEKKAEWRKETFLTCRPLGVFAFFFWDYHE